MGMMKTPRAQRIAEFSPTPLALVQREGRDEEPVPGNPCLGAAGQAGTAAGGHRACPTNTTDSGIRTPPASPGAQGCWFGFIFFILFYFFFLWKGGTFHSPLLFLFCIFFFGRGWLLCRNYLALCFCLKRGCGFQIHFEPRRKHKGLEQLMPRALLLEW